MAKEEAFKTPEPPEAEGEPEAPPLPEAQPEGPEERASRLQSDLREKEEELGRLNDRLLRLHAEFENYKKRMHRERAEFMRFANEALILELLPVLDNLERALAAARLHENAQGLLEGVEMTLRLFLSILEKLGVRPMEALGREFDPNLHQALLQVESPDGPDNIVLEEVQRGYLMENRVLRPALVKVSRAAVEGRGDAGQIAGEKG